MHRRMVRNGLAVTLTLTIGLAIASPAGAAAPWIMMVSGGALPRPVFIPRFEDNARILAALNIPADPSRLQGRPKLSLWLYWGPGYEHYLQQGGSLAALRPEDANQRGVYYPATDTAPAVIELFGSGRGPLIVDQAGLTILAHYAVPTSTASLAIGSIPPNSGAPPRNPFAAILALFGLASLMIGGGLRAAASRRQTYGGSSLDEPGQPSPRPDPRVCYPPWSGVAQRRSRSFSASSTPSSSPSRASAVLNNFVGYHVAGRRRL